MADFEDFAPATATTSSAGGAVDFDSFKPEAEAPASRTPKGFGDFIAKTGREAASLGDLVLGIPGQLIGVGADLGMRARTIGAGGTRTEQAEAGAAASARVNETLGQPIAKLLALAGLGAKEGEQTTVDAVMGKAAELIGKGGEWVEKNTNGLLTKRDVESITNAAMGAAGGRGLAAGLKKMVPEGAALAEGVRLSPYALRRLQEERMQAMDPKGVGPEVTAQAAEAATAASGKTRMTEGKNLKFDPIRGTLDEAIPEMGEGLPKASTLETALNKVADGQSFDMTAEERIAYQGWKKEAPPAAIVDEQGNALTSGPIRNRGPYSRQRGAVDMGAFIPRKEGEPGLSLEQFEALSPALSLGSLIQRSDYTLKTLDRLPQNKTEFTKAHIEQELKRADVTDAERGAVTSALEQTPGDKISAKDLMVGVKKATGDFELEAKKTHEYADYGLDSIGRDIRLDVDAVQDLTPEEVASQLGGEGSATTTLYRLPSHLTLSDANHFSDPNLFGWTRSFTEDGKRHVVEVQSDLAQHTKPLNEEAYKAADTEIRGIDNRLEALNDQIERVRAKQGALTAEQRRAGAADYYAELGPLTRQVERLKLRERELANQLASSDTGKQVAPILKNWPKRLVREELAQAAEAGEPAVRFATADTVAKVEGWPVRDPYREAVAARDSYQRQYNNLKEQAARYVEVHKAGGQGRYNPDTADGSGWHTFTPGELRAQVEKIAEDKAILSALKEKLDAATSHAASMPLKAEKPTFRPEHQSIYDRYRRDIEKFTTQLGGKPVTDAQGNAWIEVPTPRRGPKQMFGAADPKLLARMAAIGLGAWAGQYFGSDHDLLDAVMGAGAGAVLGHVTPTKAVAGLRALAKPDSRIKINAIADAHEKITKLAAIDVWGLQKQVEKLVPKKADREAITHAIEANDVKSLPPKSQAAARIVVDYYDSKLWEGISADVLKSAKDNYVTHLWDWSKNNPGLIAQWLDRSGTSGGMSPSSPYAKARSVPTIADGKAAGLTPLTEDISQIMGIYGNSVSRSIANKHFMEALKSERDPTGRPLVIAAADAPHSYRSVNTPQLAGMRVHPDIEPSLKMLFDTSSPGAAMKIMAGISDTAKRVAVTASLFHAKALTDALIGGQRLSKMPGSVVRAWRGAFAPETNIYLQELRKGSASPLVERAAEGGLTFSLERAGAGVEDAGAGFYGAMKWAQGALDKTIPHSGILIKGAVEANHKFDTFMWARLHAGMKLDVFANKYQEILDNSAKRSIQVTPDRAARIAASFSNDLFGGLNWRRVAEDATTRWGRSLGQAVLHPGARRIMQILMFAPDWTISTTRAAVKAFGPGTGLKGLLSPVELADFHRQYLLRSAAYYLIVGDAINYSMSGHHLWENKDPTMIDMDPQGNRHMQWSKHTMEPVHWVTKPAQQAVNKLGFLPREGANQVLGTEYLSTSGKSPPMENRLRHLAKNFAPIALQQSSATQGDLDTILAGMAGVPIYGSTPEQKAERKRLRKLKKEAAK